MMLGTLTEAMDAAIQGGSDMGRRVSEDELQQALDSCGKPFADVGKNAVSLRLHLLICTQYDNKKPILCG